MKFSNNKITLRFTIGYLLICNVKEIRGDNEENGYSFEFQASNLANLGREAELNEGRKEHVRCKIARPGAEITNESERESLFPEPVGCENSPSSGTKGKHNYCATCGISFRYDKVYLKHCKEIHDDRNPFECQYCEKSYRRKRSLVKHVNKEHATNDNPYARWKKGHEVSCDICRTVFPGWTAMEKHAVSVHGGMRMIGCDHCEKKFLRRTTVLCHMRSKHPKTTDFYCSFCDNTFASSDALKKHDKGQCEMRQLMKRKKENVIDFVEEEAEPFKCSECEEVFKTSALLNNHYKYKHKRKKLFPCAYCPKSFSVEKYLRKHVDAVHADEPIVKNRKYTKGNVYTCPHCGQTLRGLITYQNHSKVHPGKPMFTCNECGAGFVFRHSLRQHANERHGTVKTCCAHCNKCYYNAEYLRKHEKSCKRKRDRREEWAARGLPVYHCDICDEEFYMLESSFKNHLSRHKDFDFCDFCNDGFHRANNPDGLTRHLRIRHPLRSNIAALLETAAELATARRENAE